MSDRNLPPLDRLAGRLTELEELLTHQQRAIEALDEAARELAQRMDTLEGRLAGLSAHVGRLSEAEQGPPHDEAPPPHY